MRGCIKINLRKTQRYAVHLGLGGMCGCRGRGSDLERFSRKKKKEKKLLVMRSHGEPIAITCKVVTA